MPPTDDDRKDSRSAPASRRLVMTAMESALLLNLLSDNARAWNAPLRAQLRAVVSDTEAFNAGVAIKEGKV